MSVRFRALVGLAAAAAALGPGAVAARAGLWSAPATLAVDGTSRLGDVAIAQDGTALVAWGNGPVRAAVRPAGRAFRATQTLDSGAGSAPAVALDGNGGAVVAWSREDGSLRLAEASGGASFLTPVSSSVTGVRGAPAVGFLGPGRALVVWAGTDGGIHALVHRLGGADDPLPDLAPGPGNAGPVVGAAGGRAVVAWTSTQTAGSTITTVVRGSVLTPAGSFGPAEDIASATADPGAGSGSTLLATKVAVSANGAADALIIALRFLGMPGDTSVAGLVAARPAGAWLAPQQVGFADGLPAGGAYDADVAAGSAGDALYVDGAKQSASPTMAFSARRRPVGSGRYGSPSALFAGAPGQIRAAPLAAQRFLVLLRSGRTLRSRAGSPTTGFGAPLVFSSTDVFRLLGLDGAPSGLGVAAWVTTGGRVQAAVYDDSLSAPSPPPPAARDTVAPALSRLSISPRRFRARWRWRGARIRWRLSEPARMTLRIERVRGGYRRGKRCVARRPHSRHVRRCTRYVRAATLVRTARAGFTTVRFRGVPHRRRLHPGRYRLTASARDAAGNRSKPKRVRFTILRPRPR